MLLAAARATAQPVHDHFADAMPNNSRACPSLNGDMSQHTIRVDGSVDSLRAVPSPGHEAVITEHEPGAPLHAPESLSCTLIPPGYLDCRYDKSVFALSEGPHVPVEGVYSFVSARTLRDIQFPIYMYAIDAVTQTLFTKGHHHPVADIHGGEWERVEDGTYTCQPPAAQCGFLQLGS